MRIDPRQSYAVLTGDIEGSSKLPVAERKRLGARLVRVGAELQRVHGAAVPLPLEVFRGDAWQLLVTEPGRALRVALELAAALRSLADMPLATRVGIGIGAVRFVPAKSVAGGDGPAYAAAGAALDGLGAHERLGLGFAPAEAAALGAARVVLLGALVTSLDAVAQDWTRARARAVLEALRGATQAETGASWRPKAISQQAVAQHLAKGRWHAIDRGVGAFEGALVGHDLQQAPGLVKPKNKRRSL